MWHKGKPPTLYDHGATFITHLHFFSAAIIGFLRKGLGSRESQLFRRSWFLRRVCLWMQVAPHTPVSKAERRGPSFRLLKSTCTVLSSSWDEIWTLRLLDVSAAVSFSLTKAQDRERISISYQGTRCCGMIATTNTSVQFRAWLVRNSFFFSI